MYMHQYLDIEEYKRRKRRKWRSTCPVPRLGKGDSKIEEHLMISKSDTGCTVGELGTVAKLEEELKKLVIEKEVLAEYN